MCGFGAAEAYQRCDDTKKYPHIHKISDEVVASFQDERLFLKEY